MNTADLFQIYVCPWDTNKVGAFMFDVLPAELNGASWGRYFASANA